MDSANTAPRPMTAEVRTACITCEGMEEGDQENMLLEAGGVAVTCCDRLLSCTVHMCLLAQPQRTPCRMAGTSSATNSAAALTHKPAQAFRQGGGAYRVAGGEGPQARVGGAEDTASRAAGLFGD